MTAQAITVALGTLGAPIIICVVLQIAKAVFKLPTSAVRPVAVALGVAAAVGYQLYEHAAPDLAVAVAVGVTIGLSAQKIYDGLKGTFQASEVTQLLPVAQEGLPIVEKVLAGVEELLVKHEAGKKPAASTPAK